MFVETRGQLKNKTNHSCHHCLTTYAMVLGLYFLIRTIKVTSQRETFFLRFVAETQAFGFHGWLQHQSFLA
ncbi:hypothetical protein BDW75DRAFT_110106 [Aspergillus navahoensis]